MGGGGVYNDFATVTLDACNLSGLVAGWHTAVMELRANLPSAGTLEVNRHPISQLWAKLLNTQTL